MICPLLATATLPDPEKCRERRKCSVDGCSHPASCKSLCRTHYSRLRTHGDPLYDHRKPKRIVSIKKCSKCLKIKPADDFARDARYLDGKYPSCRQCERERRKVWRDAHRELFREKNKTWRAENPEKARAIYARYSQKKLSTPEGKLICNMSSAVRSCLYGTKKSRRWESLVGYTFEKLREHLQKHFQLGMTWENYGINGWWVDHKIPIAAFNFSTPEDLDFKRCWALKNLRPMWARDNIVKKDKVDRPFQPSLSLQVPA